MELRAVGGQVDRRRSGTLDGPFDGLHLVDVEIVHDDDIAGLGPQCSLSFSRDPVATVAQLGLARGGHAGSGQSRLSDRFGL